MNVVVLVLVLRTKIALVLTMPKSNSVPAFCGAKVLFNYAVRTTE